MKPEALDALRKLNEECEGKDLTHMYLDVKGLVTTGTGNLIDPVTEALRVWWKRPDGETATQSEVIAAWNRVKQRQDAVKIGGNQPFWHNLTSIRADETSLMRLYCEKVSTFESYCRKTFPTWDDLPWQVQTACGAMCYAMGERFHDFPRFCAAVNAGDWKTAAVQSHMDETGNPGLHKRNVAIVKFFASLDATIDVTDGGPDKPVYGLPDV